MVEKIIINPTKVRGYGNIMNVHSSTDYELSDCTITETTDTVNGATETVYELEDTILFFDPCRTDLNNDSGWFNNESYGTYSYTDTGRLDTGTLSNGYWRYTIRPNNNNFYTTPIKATFEVVEINYTPAIWVNVQGTTISSNSLDLNSSNCQSGDIVEVEIGSTSAKWIINGTVNKTLNYTGATGYRVELGCYKSTSQQSSAPSLKIKNFKITTL